jgi:outer membrane protein assembly factor BamB
MIARIAAAQSLLALFIYPAEAADWPQWRGPKGTGQSDEQKAPLTWSSTENVKWKVALDGAGNSSPIVVGQKVFITHAPANSPLRGIQCYDRDSGSLVWKHQTEYGGEPEGKFQNNPYCSASPVTDGERVVAWYGSAGLFCYDIDGKLLWQKDLGKVEHIWEFGSSPLIHENLVYLNFGPGLNTFVAAFDKRTGDEVWRKTFPGQSADKREEYRGSWSTPVIFQDAGRSVLVLSLPERLYAVDPRTGEEIWSCGGLDKLVYTSPLFAGEIVIAMCGYGGAAMAVKGGGQGDVTSTHRLWHHTQKNPQRVGSGVVVGDYIYILNEPGIAWCLEAKTGEKKWEQRISPNTWSSMVHAAGRLYVCNKQGTTYVLEATPEECKVLAENKLGESLDASPAFSNGQIFIRTHKSLHCIEAK